MSTRKVYMVIERSWGDLSDFFDEGIYTAVKTPDAGTPLKAFRDPAKATEHCQALERKHRAKANPFDYGNPYRGLDEVSSLDADRFHDWLLDAGIDPPAQARAKSFTLEGWSKWWAKSKKSLSEYQQAKVWEALDKVRFYSVIELDQPEE